MPFSRQTMTLDRHRVQIVTQGRMIRIRRRPMKPAGLSSNFALMTV